MKFFFIRNWLGVLGLLIGLIGLYCSFYFYNKSKSTREPLFLIDPQRTEILNNNTLKNAPIKVFTAKGDEVKAGLTSIRFYFWNQGNLSVRQENILEPIKISLADSNSKIIDFKILKASRPITKITLQKDTSDLRTLFLKFNILEKSDGITGQILYEGNPLSKVKISGIIEGAQPIGDSDKILSNLTFLDYMAALSDFWVIFIFLLSIIPVGVLYIKIQSLKIWTSTRLGRIIAKVFISIGTVLVTLVIVVFVCALIYGTILDPINEAKSSKSNQVQRIPQSIKVEK